MGTGRSGTTTVARLLHEHLGVNMGARFVTVRATNEHCYEDEGFYSLEMDLLSSGITFPTWQRQILTRVREKEAVGDPWGFKSPTLSTTLPLWLPYFKEQPSIIWADRAHDATTASFIKCWGMSQVEATNEWKWRQQHLRTYLHYIPHLKLNFDTQRTDEELLEELEKYIA